MKSYLELLQKILDHGEDRPDRTGTGTLSLFGEQLRFDLSKGFPLLTTKKLHFKSIACELLWMLSGSTNVRSLQAQGVTIWDEWANANGDLGLIYGQQWRRQTSWGSDINGNFIHNEIDQIQTLIDSLRDDPYSRRHVVNAWNAADVPSMALAPCHMSFQMYVSKDNKLSCHMYQRSCDFFLGAPYNIASYAMLTMMLCATHGFTPGELVISYGDVHLYKNHIEQAKLQLTRTPKHLPELFMHGDWRGESILDMHYNDFNLRFYDPWPSIKAEVSV